MRAAMTKPSVVAARSAVAVMAMCAMAACADGSSSAHGTSPTPSAPQFVESDACRSQAHAFLDDADAGAALTKPKEISRYLESATTSASTLPCTAGALSAVASVTTTLTEYYKAWLGCEVAGQWFDYDGDGQPDGTTDCADADRPFTDLKSAISTARTVIDLKQ